MRILITGANGQLGRTLMDLSSGYGHEFMFTSRTSGDGVVPLDVTDMDAVNVFMKAYGPIDVIINCSGYTDVNRAEDEAERAYELNVRAVANLAEAARKEGAVLIHFSTDYVYDGEADSPYCESDRTNPLGVYAKTKLEGDEAVMESGCRYLIFRTSWLYSRHGKNFFKTIGQKAETSPEIKVVNDQFGTPTYAGDLADAVLRIIDEGGLDKVGLYNYSNEGECSWHDFAMAIIGGFGYECDVKPCCTSDYPSKVRRPAYSVLSKEKFRDTFGYEIPQWKYSLERCIKEWRG